MEQRAVVNSQEYRSERQKLRILSSSGPLTLRLTFYCNIPKMAQNNPNELSGQPIPFLFLQDLSNFVLTLCNLCNPKKDTFFHVDVKNEVTEIPWWSSG